MIKEMAKNTPTKTWGSQLTTFEQFFDSKSCLKLMKCNKKKE